VKIKKFLSSLVIAFTTMVFIHGCVVTNLRLSRPGNPDEFENYINSTVAFVQIDHANREVYGPYCTGFYISSRRIATAAHCVVVTGDPVTLDNQINFLEYETETEWRMSGSAHREQVGLPDYRRAHVVAIDEDNDVAILQLNIGQADSTNWLTMRNIVQEPLLVGERVYAVSNPTGTAWMFMEGIISRIETVVLRNLAEDNMRIMHQVRIGPGSSGSELLDANGRVIGINVAISGEGAFISQAVPVSYLQRLLLTMEVR
jgi:V8-like Glu-specific endopeptidase